VYFFVSKYTFVFLWDGQATGCWIAHPAASVRAQKMSSQNDDSLKTEKKQLGKFFLYFRVLLFKFSNVFKGCF